MGFADNVSAEKVNENNVSAEEGQGSGKSGGEGGWGTGSAIAT